MKYPEDLQTFKEFLERWKNDTLGKDDPVFCMVTDKAHKTASSWNWSDWVEDLKQQTFLNLSNSQYRGDGPLEGYIAHIMGNLVKQYWRKERRNLRVEMSEEVAIAKSFHGELEMSDRIKRLIARTPQHLWWYLEFVADLEHASERDAAKYAKVTRHQIQKIKEEIRRIWSAMERAKASGGRD